MSAIANGGINETALKREFEKRMNAKELSESDFRAMQTEGILLVETKESKALDALNLSLVEKQEILNAYDEFR